MPCVHSELPTFSEKERARIFFEERNIDVVALLAMDPGLPKWMQEGLSHRGAYIRSHLAQNPALSIDLMKKLVNDEEVSVRRALARRTNLPVDIAEMLYHDESEDVRMDLARNPYCPVGILDKFIKDENPRIRLIAAQNANVSLSSLIWFINHETPESVFVMLLAGEKIPEVIVDLAYEKFFDSFLDNAEFIKDLLDNDKPIPKRFKERLERDALKFHLINRSKNNDCR